MTLNNQDHFKILKNIYKYPGSSQRKLAAKSGLSLGKLNYCLNALINKGFVKIENFKSNEKKFNYIYVLTPRGISFRVKLTINFMKKNMEEEYNSFKKKRIKK